MKEKLFKKGITKRLFSVVLTLVMVFSLMPINSITAMAADDDPLLVTITSQFYEDGLTYLPVYSNDGIATLINDGWMSRSYGESFLTNGVMGMEKRSLTVEAAPGYSITKVEIEVLDMLTKERKTVVDTDGPFSIYEGRPRYPDDSICASLNKNLSDPIMVGNQTHGPDVVSFKVYGHLLSGCALEEKSGQEPTCTAAGWKKYYQTTDCGLIFAANDKTGKRFFNLDEWKASDEGKIAPLGHNWNSTTGRCNRCNTTCPHTGHTAAQVNCNVCGKVLHDSSTKLTKVNGQAPTCIAYGWNAYYTCACGNIYGTNDASGTLYANAAAWKTGDGKIDKIPHNSRYSVVDGSIKATCQNPGCTASGKLIITNGLFQNGSPVSFKTSDFSWSDNYLHDGTQPVIGQWYGGPYTDLKYKTSPTYSGAESEGGAPVLAGNYAVEITMGSGDNAATIKYPVTIYKQPGSGSVTMADWTYNSGTYPRPVTASETNKGYVSTYYKLTTADDSSYSLRQPTTSGDYTVKAVFDAYGDYAEAVAYTTFTIHKTTATDAMKIASGYLYGKAGSTKTIKFNLDLGNWQYLTDMTFGTPTGSIEGVTAEVENNALKLTVGETDLPTGTDPFTVTVPVESKNCNDYNITVTVTPTFHEHSFDYSMSGASLTATSTCHNEEGCEFESTQKSVTLTLTANDANFSDAPYTGASLSSTTAWTGAGLAVPPIKYAGRGTTEYPESETAPTAVGTYTASISAGGKTASVDFAIIAVKFVSDYNLVVPSNVDAPDPKTIVEELSVSSTYVNLKAGWYVVNENIEKTSATLNLNGNVNLILPDGKSLSVKSISGSSYSLTIWGQSGGTGQLVVGGSTTSYAIDSKNVTINGGNITANGHYAGIQGNIVINSGTVNASASRSGGNGLNSNENIVINNGTVIANSSSGQGINATNITVNDGTVTAYGYYSALQATSSINIFSSATVLAGTDAETASSIAYNAYNSQKYVKIIGHEHDWEYSLDGSTGKIKAHCDVAGHSGDDVSLTLSAKDADYSGDPVSINVATDFSWGITDSSLATPEIGDWYVDASTKTTSANSGASGVGAAPVNVGRYYVEVTVDSDSNTATAKYSFTVNQATGSGNVTMAGWTYGGTASDPVPTSTTNGTSNVSYRYKAKTASDSTYTSTKPSNAGTYTVKATFAETSNYTEATATADFTISKADATDAMKAASGSLNAKANSTVSISFTNLPADATFGTTTGAISGVTAVIESNALKLTVGGSDLAAETSAFTVSVPVNESANYNTYNIAVTVTPTYHTHSFNYSASGAKITATSTCHTDADCEYHATGSKTVELTLTASSANYSGSAATITVGTNSEQTAWICAGLTVPTVISYEKADGTALNAAPTTVGSYVAKVSPIGVTASATNTAQVSFTIEKAPATFTTRPTEKTGLIYSGEAQALVNAGSGVTGGTLKYSTTENGTYSETIPTGTNAGSYSVWYKIVGDAEHSDKTAVKVDVTIAKKDVKVSGIKAVEKAYDGTTSVSLDCSNAIFDGKLEADTLTITATGTMADAKIGTNKEVRLSNLVLGDTSADNYQVKADSQTTTTVTVSPVVINKDTGDFDIGSTTPSKEFIVGSTSVASVHIDGLELTDMHKVGEEYKGILVMEETKVLEQGEDKDYTVTSGSVKVNLTKKYLDTLPVGTHEIKVYVKQGGVAAVDDKNYEFNVNVVIKVKPSTGGGTSAPTTTPTYKVPNTSVGNENNSITKTIGLLAIAAVAGYVVKKKEN